MLCGQTISPMLGKDAFQEADVTGITYQVVKHSYLVKDPNDVPRIMREAFHIATTGRPGPVLIDLPKDVTSAPCTAKYSDAVNLPGYKVPKVVRFLPALPKSTVGKILRRELREPGVSDRDG